MCPSPTKFHSNQLQMGSVVRKCRKYLRQKKSSLMKPNELPCGQRPRTVGIRGTGEGQAPSDFDRSVRYLMSTVGQIMPTNYYLPPPLPPIFRPSYGPVIKYNYLPQSHLRTWFFILGQWEIIGRLQRQFTSRVIKCVCPLNLLHVVRCSLSQGCL